MESGGRSSSSGLVRARSLELGRPVGSDPVRQYDVGCVGGQRLCASPVALGGARARRRRQSAGVQGARGGHGGTHRPKCRGRRGMCQSPAERGRLVGDAKIGLRTVRAACWLGHQQPNRLLRRCVGIVFVVSFWVVRLRSLDLYEAFATDRLVATPRVVEIRRIGKEADWAFSGVLVQEHLERLAVDEGVVGKGDFAREDLGR